MSWKTIDNRLTKTYTLSGFNEIIDGLDNIRQIANQMNHHPDFEVFDYKNIRFKLYTHDSDSVSDLDYALADKIDQVYS